MNTEAVHLLLITEMFSGNPTIRDPWHIDAIMKSVWDQLKLWDPVFNNTAELVNALLIAFQTHGVLIGAR